MKFYRYESRTYASIDEFGDFVSPSIPDVRVILQTYDLIRETPKGYWIGWLWGNGSIGYKRWVSKTSRKRYAYPTKEEAMNNFVKRTERRIKILKNQTRQAEFGLLEARKLQKNEIGTPK